MPGQSLGSKLGLLGAIIVALVALAGVFFPKNWIGPPPHPSSIAMPAHAPAAATTTASAGPDPNIDFQCLMNRIQKPPAPFHLSFKKSTKTINGDWETDITPDTINGTVVDASGTRPIHGARSNVASWGAAVTAVEAPVSGSASTVALVRNSSAITRAGMENVNGEKTIKYQIDTTHDTIMDAALIGSLLGEGGFIKGTVWVTKDGCPVKLVLDSQMSLSGGNGQKQHYEGNVTQKQ